MSGIFDYNILLNDLQSFDYYLLRTLAEMAEKEQQIKVLKTDVLEKERKISGEKKQWN